MSDEAYLQPGFDPNTLKVAELRGLLLKHDVEFPSSAKKAQLVDLFNNHVVPLSQSILDKNNTRASSRGIQDVDRYGEPLEKNLRASPRKRSRSARRATRYNAIETIDDVPTATESDQGILDTISTSPAKTAATVPVPHSSIPASVSSATKPSKRSRFSDLEKATEEESIAEETPRLPRRPTRRSVAPLSPPAESDMESIRKRDEQDKDLQSNIQQGEDDSVFSSENPFQSGSSPPVRMTPRNKDDRRKSMPKGATLSSIEKTGTRRKTDFPVVQTSTEVRKRISDVSPIVPAVQPPSIIENVVNFSPSLVKEESYDGEDIPPGEEFTPEGQQELAELEREDKLVRKKRNSPKREQALGTLLWVLLGTLLLAYFSWWRKEKIDLGYCNVGKALYKTDDKSAWFSSLRPSCEPCPPNAVCKPNFEIECQHDYVLKPNPLSLWGLIPLPPACEPDSAKFQKIQYLSEEAGNVLREREARIACGNLKLGKDEPRGLSENELYSRMYERKAPKYSDEEFNQIWKQALEELVSKDEIEVTEQSYLLPSTSETKTATSKTGIKYLRSTSLVKVPFTCVIRLTIYNTLQNYKIELLGLLALITTALQIRIHINKSREYNKLVEKYVHVALQTLAKQSRISSMTGALGISSYVPVVQLRDQVLQHEFDPAKRKKLWLGVQKVVEGNSNIRASSREIQGEVLRCWCWIGGVGQIEDTRSMGKDGAVGEAELEEALMLSGKGSQRAVA